MNQGSVEHWTEQINVGHTPLRFRVDTGADVTVMNLKTCTDRAQRKLVRSSGPLDSPEGTLSIVGQFTDRGSTSLTYM